MLVVILTSMQSVGADNPPSIERHFSEEKIEELRSDRDFFYVDMEENQSDYYDIWGRYFLKFLSNIVGSKPAYFIFSNFNYILLAIVIIILFFNRNKINFRKLVYGNRKANGPSIIIEEEDIAEIDFAEHIARALKNKNYKFAVRYQYLELLKNLSEKGLINWEAYKTNYEYLLELKDTDIRNHYRKASLIFDYIWYGNFEISETDYLESRREFEALKEQLKQA